MRWNPACAGFTLLIEGAFGLGKVKAIRKTMLAKTMHTTYGSPATETKSFSIHLRYTIEGKPKILITPYTKYIKIFGHIHNYK